MKKYLFFVSLSYSYSIMRPIQEEIRRRGDDAAWFIENPCPVLLNEDEKQLKTIQEVIDYNPIAVFAPGNHIYDFFPGIKVQVFHGFPINKRPGVGEHYFIKGLFDLYCTIGYEDTKIFEQLSEKHKYFKVIQTGWAKIDSFFDEKGEIPVSQNTKPTALYSSTFTKWITSAPYLYDEIERLIQVKDWNWLLTLHPKTDKEIVEKYKSLNKYNNAHFYEGGNHLELLKQADVMVCDSSSIIVEFLFFRKPVVTFRNTSPGAQLIDIQNKEDLADSIEKALTRPPELMNNIETYIQKMHPFQDGKSSGRILDAVDYFIANYKGKIKKKPLNLIRKLKMRKKAGYFPFGPRYKTSN